MSTLDPVAAEARARAAVGHEFYPTGYCLEHNYEWWGSVESIGPGHGHFVVAIDGWDYAVLKHAGDRNPPAGVPLYFGVSLTRRDNNAPDGDIGFSIGGGQGIFTDAAGATVGVMSIAAREAETQRPYLGWSGDFLGHDIGGISTASVGAETIITNPSTITPTEDEMDLRVIIADSAADKANKAYGSTAVITAHRGFVQTSTGLGARTKLNEWTAAAGACGIPVVVKRVSVNAFNLAKLF